MATQRGCWTHLPQATSAGVASRGAQMRTEMAMASVARAKMSGGSAGNVSHSKVRVDTIGLEVASCLTACHLSHYPWTKKLSVKGRECADGAEVGRTGYVAPSCFMNGTRLCAQALAKETKKVREEQSQEQ